MTLLSDFSGPFAFPLFNTEPQVVAAATNNPAFSRGMRGSGVAMVQNALSTVGYHDLLPITFRTGKADGAYGKETDKAVRAFQRDHGLRIDGDAGRYTLAALDSCLSGWSSPNKPPVPKPNPPRPVRSRHYELGTGDLTIKHDYRPIGPRSKGVTHFQMIDLHICMLGFANVARLSMPLASKHLRHYLSGSGTAVSLDVQHIVRNSRAAQGVYQGELSQARKFCETLPEGTHRIRSKTPETSFFRPDQDKDYFFGIGGYSYWGTGEAEINDVNGRKHYRLRFRYVMKDFYNWNPGQGVTLPGFQGPNGVYLWPKIAVSDRLMDEFRRRGLAKEFHVKGSWTSDWTWKEGDPPLKF